jgi:carboxypeptidase C (cathepsin A)
MRYFSFLMFLSLALFAEDTITHHFLELEQTSLSYTATVGTLPARDREGNPKGTISYIAYTQNEPAEARRPITFAFNGGPGSASIWLHVGALGPRRIRVPEEGQSVIPPYAMVDNQETLLDLTDLVFVDPVGTGFSHPDSKEDGKLFYSVDGDIQSLGDFIREYITVNKRWNSPKYLAGESYGTTRACGLAEYLQNEHSMYLHGLILISCAIDFQTFSFGCRNSDNLLPYVLNIPTYAATAWYHGRYKTDTPLEQVLQEASLFAYQKYLPILYQRSPINEESLYEEMAELTGLPLRTIRRYQGKISRGVFVSEFFGDENRNLGMYDTRLVGDLGDPEHFNFSEDPSVRFIAGIMSGAFNDYLQAELNHSDSRYQILSLDVNEQWDFFSHNCWGYPNLMDSLRSSLLVNPQLKVFVGSGCYDSVTPFGATDYCFNHLGLPEAYKANISQKLYEGGHMYYFSPAARIQFKSDLTDFYLGKRP